MRTATLATVACITAFAAIGASADCTGPMPAATTTWKTTCNNVTSLGDASCWTNGQPTSASTVAFPAGTNVTMGTWFNSTFALPYVVFRAANIVIAPGAIVNMTGDAIEVSNCLRVEGQLNLLSVLDWSNSMNSQWTQAPVGDFLPDPAQPLGTDCSKVPVGFTPRICGPGKFVVSSGGAVVANGLYSSFFLGGNINAGANMTLSNQAFLWGELTNNGRYVSRGYTYQHGMIINNGTAHIGTIAFDKWATAFIANTEHPLLIRNTGQLHFDGNGIYPTNVMYPGMNSEMTYRAAVINDGFTTISAWTAPFGVDFYNLGTMEWFSSEYQFEGEGTYINRGTMIANGQSVYLNALQSLGGTIVQKNGGYFELDNGSPNAARSATMRLCSLVTGMPSTLQATYKANARKLDLANRHLYHNEANMVTFKDGCTWYCGHCYQVPYDVFPPVAARLENGPTAPRAVDPTGLPIHRHGGDVRLLIQKALAEDIVPVEPCTGRYRLVNTTIRGDGKSSALVSTVPVEVLGTVTLESGAKWHVATERGSSPVVGGGKIVVGNGAVFLLGIEAEFRFDGILEVRRGGTLAVPRHSKIAITNHTVTMRPGSTLHVDGSLHFGERRGGHLALDLCGQVDGIGRLSVDHEDALRCSVEDEAAAAKKKAAGGDSKASMNEKPLGGSLREALLERLRGGHGRR